MHRPVAPTALLEPIHREPPGEPMPPKAAARFAAAFRPLARFPTRRVLQPQAVVTVSLTRTLLWRYSLGIFDKAYPPRRRWVRTKG
jgi:hypothetical protein